MGLLWALGTFFLPFVILPLYLIFRYAVRHRVELLVRNASEMNQEAQMTVGAVPTESQRREGQRRLLALSAYALLLLGATVVYLYQDYNSVDAHLARATQAKLASKPAKTILEYRTALSLEDNPHTHKLLGIELAERGQWAEAVKEFRLAEGGGEADESLPFRIAQALSVSGDHSGSVAEYKRFLESHACIQDLPDDKCETARRAVGGR